jgi:hypothetical protein
VRFVPLTEGCSIDQEYSTFDEGIRADKLVVRSIVYLGPRFRILYVTLGKNKSTYNSNNSRLLRNMLRSPCKITRIKTEGTELGVTTPCAYSVHTFRAKLGVCWLTAELEFSFLTIVGALGTCCGTFVPGCTRDTCRIQSSSDPN